MAKFTLLHAGATSGASASIGMTGLRDFASAWPCFGDITGKRLFASWDSKGDLVDVQGDDGLDGVGVAALLDDVQRRILQLVPDWQCVGHRERLGVSISESVA